MCVPALTDHLFLSRRFQEYKPSGSAVVPKGTTKSNTTVALKCQLKSEILRHKDGLRRVV